MMIARSLIREQRIVELEKMRLPNKTLFDCSGGAENYVRFSRYHSKVEIRTC